jgi:hypothetical protein
MGRARSITGLVLERDALSMSLGGCFVLNAIRGITDTFLL